MTPTPPAPHPALFTDEQLAHHLRAGRQLHEAPEWVIRRVLSLAPAALPLPGWGEWAAGLRRVVASLVLDTGMAPAWSLGLRSGADAVRQLLFSAEGRDIDLRVTPAGEGAPGWVIAGQVLGPDLCARVLLCAVPADAAAGAAAPHEATLSDLAEFRFGPVAAGRWQLRLLTDGLAIEFPAFDVPPG